MPGTSQAKLAVAVVGATGAVGETMLAILADQTHFFDANAFVGARCVPLRGTPVEPTGNCH